MEQAAFLPLIEAIFTEGYMFRCLMRYASGLVSEVILQFTPAGVACIKMSTRMDVVNYFFISSEKMGKDERKNANYRYNASVPRCNFKVNLSTLANAVKEVGVKNGQVKLVFVNPAPSGA